MCGRVCAKPACMHMQVCGVCVQMPVYGGVRKHPDYLLTPHRSRALRTPANMFVINLAISDFLMSFTQAPVFFASSLYKRWLFGEAGWHLGLSPAGGRRRGLTGVPALRGSR